MEDFLKIIGFTFCVFMACGILTTCVNAAESIKPPVAKTKPKELEAHGHTRIDPYYWLRGRENPEVIDYLEAENRYTETMMAHTKDFQENLFQEIKGRIKETDQSVPVKRDDYFYYTRMEEGKQYPIYCRRKDSMETDEIIMLNVNQLAAGHEFCLVGGYAVSFDQDLLAYPTDTVGRRKYTIYFKNLLTGETLSETIPDTTPSLAWANDNQTLFYVKQHPQTLRFYQVYRHELGTDPSNDLLVYEEKDEEFNCFVFKTKSKKYIMIASHQTLSSEYRFFLKRIILMASLKLWRHGKRIMNIPSIIMRIISISAQMTRPRISD